MGDNSCRREIGLNFYLLPEVPEKQVIGGGEQKIRNDGALRKKNFFWSLLEIVRRCEKENVERRN